MKHLWGPFLVAFVVVCGRATAETPQQAFGVTVVGNGATCGSPATGLRCTDLSGHPYILLGGFYDPGDGGGGYLALGAAGCTDNGGTILKDKAGNCFYRMDDRAAIPVKWFGAKCDATTSAFGGSIPAGSTTFVSSAPGVTFQQSDVGKTIELNYQSATPFVTTISGYVSGTQVTLSTAAPSTYPGLVGATAASFASGLQDGSDLPGTGYKPQDILTVSCTTCGPSTSAQITVRATGLIGFGSTSGGTGYAVGDSIYFTALPAGSYTTVSAAEIQVQSVDRSGAVTGYSFLSNGDYRPTSSSIAANPATFAISTSGSGSGFSVLLAPSDGSFGVAEVYRIPTAAGQYSSFPPIPSATTDSGTGTGATVSLSFPTPAWTYATDDTNALQALETFMEKDYDRGIHNAAEIPGDHTCLLQTLTILRPVTWRSSGARQAQLMQIWGSQGSTVDGTNHAFVLVTAKGGSTSDPYQGLSLGQAAVGFNNILLTGGTTSRSVNVDGRIVSYTNDGLLFQNPAGTRNSGADGAFQNLQLASFPGHALAAIQFGGELRGYNVFAGQSGGNCVDLEHTYNPYRFYGLVASGCTIGINMMHSRAAEFHGASVFGNTIDVSLGGYADVGAYVLFDGAQFGPSLQDNLYLDQTNETLVCAANCYFNRAWQGPCPTSQSCGAIEIGPHAKTKATQQTPVIAQFNQGLFTQSPQYDVVFDTDPATGETCRCRVALGGGMLDVATQGDSSPGQPTTNDTTRLTGQTSYTQPTFANAASVGVPLTLGPAELGMGLSTDTEGPPKGAGLKLRVECSSPNSHNLKIVALAGSSGIETVIADGIGNHTVSACN